MTKVFTLNTDAYLERIGLIQKPDTNIAGLIALQRAHMLNVPFENLDVFLGRPLSLAHQDLFEKIVVRKRGGYCFELNTLYAELVKVLGFKVRPLLARVWLRDPSEVPARAHILHLVNVDGRRYITDVGFGGRTSLVPLDIDNQEPVEDGDGLIRIFSTEHHGYMLQRLLDKKWQNQFSFMTDLVYKTDIEMANHFTETHDTSHFRHARYVGMFTARGRDGLSDDALTVRTADALDVETIPLGAEWLSCISNRFGLSLRLTEEEHVRLLTP